MRALAAGGWVHIAVAAGGWLIAAVTAAMWLVGRRAETSRIELIRAACHELRGPLTAVRLGVELAARTGRLTSERCRAIELELGRAGLVLDDLTSLGGGGHGRCREALEPVELGPLLADSVEAWRPAAGVRELRLELPPGFAARVAGSRCRLAQATGNLIANAIEHGAGAIEVGAQTAGATVRVEVRDGGDGLPSPVAELSAGRRRRDSAHGHGLVIASAVAEAHGGRLSSAPCSSGARLVLELPLAARESAATA
jgi:signal transduction histidine kinase